VKEQIRLLLKLQEVDERLFEARHTIKDVPGKIAVLQDQATKFDALLNEERGKVEEAMGYLREQNGMLKDEEQRIAKTKQQLQLIKNAREYAASQRQMEAVKKAKMDREEEIIKLMEAIEGSKQKLAQHEAEFAELKSHLEAEEAELTKAVKKAEARIAAMENERNQAASGIDANVLRHYEIVAGRIEPVVVPARGSVCMGCHMNIPPQLYNILFRANSLEICPSCQRIIYLEAALEEDGDSAKNNDNAQGDSSD